MDVDDDEVAMFHGFGSDCVRDKYKVVFVFPDPRHDNVHRTVTKVYSFGDSSWITTWNLSIVGFQTNGLGKFVGGTLNWETNGARDVTPHQWVISSFDMRKGEIQRVLLPDFDDDNPRSPVQAVSKDCLCVCYDHEETHLVVLLMKKYEVKESWIKLMAIRHVELQSFGFLPYMEPLCMSKNGVVLVHNTFVRAVLYDSRIGRLEYPNIQRDKVWYEQFIYVESLVSPYF